MKKTMRKNVLLFIAIVAICLSFAACGPKEPTAPADDSGIPANAVYDETLNATISLGLTKDAVDKLLGEPVEQGKGSTTVENFIYNNGLSIDYMDGTAYNILVTEEAVQCKISYHVAIGAELSSLPEAFSQDLGANLGRMAYYDADNQSVSVLLDAAFQVMLRTDPETEKVTSIYLMSCATKDPAEDESNEETPTEDEPVE